MSALPDQMAAGAVLPGTLDKWEAWTLRAAHQKQLVELRHQAMTRR